MSTIQHEYECLDDEKAVIGEESAIITLGSTGTGKSSIIQTFCGQHVKVGHGESSETSQSTIFKELNSNRYWLDTQGANDSNGVDDEQVLTDILKKLYNENITNIKIIWCVSGDLLRMKKEFQTQANFIMSLGSDKSNPWDSCLVLKKEGRPIPKPQKMKGILAAIKNSNHTIIKSGDVRLFGFTGLEWINIDDDALLLDFNEEYKDNPKKLEQKYKQWGYFTNQEIMDQLNGRLEKLAPLKIQFEMKQCSKCGIKGDPRYIYEKCHVEPEQHHDGHLNNYHPGQLQRVHTGKYKGGYGCKHTQSFKERFNKARRGAITAFSFGQYNVDGYYPCCNRSGGNAKPCTEIKKWSCCAEDNQFVIGCTYQWDCCEIEKGKSGCRRKYECCNVDEGLPGCSIRCQTCQVKWGEGPGCIKTNK